jgi:predicted TIM-barrel fold metal-dependent hydrolase
MAAGSSASVRLAATFYGADHLLFASDYPWWPLERAVELAGESLGENELSAVLHGNAVRLLGLTSDPAAS